MRFLPFMFLLVLARPALARNGYDLTTSERRYFGEPLLAVCDSIIQKAAKSGNVCTIPDPDSESDDSVVAKRPATEDLISSSGTVTAFGIAPDGWDSEVRCGENEFHVSLGANAQPRQHSRDSQHGSISLPNKESDNGSDYEFSSTASSDRLLSHRVAVGEFSERHDTPVPDSAATVLARPVSVLITVEGNVNLRDFIDVDVIRGILAASKTAPLMVRSPEAKGPCEVGVPGKESSEDENEMSDVDFVVLGSFQGYSEAFALLQKVHAETKFRIDLRGLVFENGMLTESRRDCKRDEWDYPCQAPRGRWDDGVYFSIEGEKGPFEVVAASGPHGDKCIASIVDRVRQKFPKVSLVTRKVYMGCMH